ncbi:hypothetical protein BD410DRAFT_795589 [Rickenella mellea]|uniref:Uncharacterized protein n=1 Tax=Rickenella mellea TaxID=50990 RepID=A0A4Y7PLH9_9AGAM|nr:hypothetical protein BD410DRAFT_795589 [Rickenella mellea]
MEDSGYWIRQRRQIGKYATFFGNLVVYRSLGLLDGFRREFFLASHVEKDAQRFLQKSSMFCTVIGGKRLLDCSAAAAEREV